MSKKHKLPRLSKSLLEKPQFIIEEKAREIAEVLDNRELLHSYAKEAFFDDDQDDFISDEETTLLSNGIGTLHVEGPTTYKKTGWEAMCGGCSYVGLIEDMEELVEKGVSTVLMKVNSGGGQAYRMMYSANKLRELADKNNIKMIGYVDGMAASAGYGLLSACHEIVVNPEAEVGSVGVVVSLMNNSKHLEKEGFERTFITAGSEKVPYDKDGSFREGFLSDIQESVDTLYEKFTSHVASMRNIDVQTVIDTQAKIMKAEKALEIGFIDKIMEEDEFQEYLGIKPKGKNSNSPSGVETLNMTTEEQSMSKEAQATPTVDQTELSTLQAKLAAQEEVLASLQAEKEEKELLASKVAEYEKKEALAHKESLNKELSKHAFLKDSQEDVLEFLLASNVDTAHKELVSGLISQASASVSELEKTLSTTMEEFNSEKEALQAEMNTKIEELKTSFGEEIGANAEAEVEPTSTAKDQDAVMAKLLARHKKNS